LLYTVEFEVDEFYRQRNLRLSVVASLQVIITADDVVYYFLYCSTSLGN